MFYCNVPNFGLNPSLTFIISYVVTPVNVGQIHRPRRPNYPKTSIRGSRIVYMRIYSVTKCVKSINAPEHVHVISLNRGLYA